MTKAERIKRNYIATGYKIYEADSRTQRFPWVPTNQAQLGTQVTCVPIRLTRPKKKTETLAWAMTVGGELCVS